MLISFLFIYYTENNINKLKILDDIINLTLAPYKCNHSKILCQ